MGVTTDAYRTLRGEDAPVLPCKSSTVKPTFIEINGAPHATLVTHRCTQVEGHYAKDSSVLCLCACGERWVTNYK